MNLVFLDTVGIIAMLDESDQWHAAAVEAYMRMRSLNVRTVTTPHVLWECGNAASRRPYRRDIAELRAKLQQWNRIISVSDADEESAWTAYLVGTAGTAGIVDHISFAVMRKLGIRHAFTNDKHFTSAGFEALF